VEVPRRGALRRRRLRRDTLERVHRRAHRRQGLRPSPAAPKLTPNELTTAQNNDRNQFYRELHSRYLRSFYPSKLFVGYNQSGLDITVGDFYAQLGRGLVFSVRKIDELAIDTTVRGIKVVADHDFGAFRLAGTVFAGQMNPLRSDEATGAQAARSRLGALLRLPPRGRSRHLRLRLRHRQAHQGHRRRAPQLPRGHRARRPPRGRHPKLFTLGANTAVLARKSNSGGLPPLPAGRHRIARRAGASLTQGLCGSQHPDFTLTDESKLHNTILTYSGSLTIPSIAKHGDLYLEVAGQNLRDGHLGSLGEGGKARRTRRPIAPATPSTASGSVSGGPVSVSLELKHYRRFFQLSANIDTDSKGLRRARVQHHQLQLGPHGRAHLHAADRLAQHVHHRRSRPRRLPLRAARPPSTRGRAATPAGPSSTRATSSARSAPTKRRAPGTSAVGVDLGFESGASHARAWFGARTTDLVRPENADPNAVFTFYREGYIRYDLVKQITGPLSIQMQGFHRHRYEPVNFTAIEAAEEPWTEGENYTALQWSPHLSAVVGYEYRAKTGCQAEVPATQEHALAAREATCVTSSTVGYSGAPARATRAACSRRTMGRLFDTVAVFVGQRRGAVRCVSGVCRQFPPFEGAKLEITSRF
jgi:hypothetical protein